MLVFPTAPARAWSVAGCCLRAIGGTWCGLGTVHSAHHSGDTTTREYPPYLGLVAFGPAAEGMLFGRDDDVARLAHELSHEVALVLQGVSGSGKSSLAMAGVVPALARRDAASGPDWRAVVVRPGTDSHDALDRALAGVAPELRGASAAEAAAFARGRGVGLGFVFDQLEELVTQASPATRARFVTFLAEAAELPRDAPLRVVGTLREDFTSTILGLPPLGERLRDALRFVGPPTMAAVRAIVRTRPSWRA